MIKKILLTTLLFCVTSSYTAIFCPRTFTCPNKNIEDCSVPAPFVAFHNDESVYPGTYHFWSAWYIIPIRFGTGIRCSYTYENTNQFPIEIEAYKYMPDYDLKPNYWDKESGGCLIAVQPQYCPIIAQENKQNG